ncbi:MAG: calcium/proton exchanger [Gemmatimonadales bacterium]
MSASDIRRVVDTARNAAAAAGHAFVGTEHLLAALLIREGGAAARAFRSAGGAMEGLVEELAAGLKTADPALTGPPPLSGFAERAVQDAERAAEEGKDGEAALFEALTRSPRGRIASVMSRRGIRPATLHPAVTGSESREASGREGGKRQKEKRPARPAAHPPERASGRGREAPDRAGREKREESERKTAAAEPREPPPRPRELPPHLRSRSRRLSWRLVLLVMVPVSVALDLMHASEVWIFIAACLAVLPLAALMGDATEQLAERTGPTIGGLLNATFGNAAELIIAVVALRAGLVDLVKASITGSILGNLLLILGLSLVAAGTRTPVVRFNRTSAGMSAAMLALAVVGLVFPALFHGLAPGAEQARLALTELRLSEAVAIILAAIYGLSLLFTLKTHKSLFGGDPAATPEGPTWSMGRSVLVLALATGGVVIESELLVHAVEGVTAGLGLSEVFLGLVIIPIIGNAAEHATAIVVARKGQTDLALQIALGSSTQVALLVAPILVLAGVILGQPMNLVFTPFEVAALAVSTIVISIITLDGESHWFEGVQLLAVYGMVAAAAFFL